VRLQAVDATLGALAAMLQGVDAPSAPLLQAGTCLLADAVPPVWDDLWAGPESAADYCRWACGPKQSAWVDCL